MNFTLAGGGTPEELVIDFSGRDLDPVHAARLNAEQREILAGLTHDVNITLVADEARSVAVLMDGAAALADFLKATRDGPLNAAGVLNLLRGGHFAVLVGEVESDFLEVKTTMHPIWISGTPGEKAKIELAQDVARSQTAMWTPYSSSAIARPPQEAGTRSAASRRWRKNSLMWLA